MPASKYQAMDAQMAADLVSMAKPVTKWSTMVVDPSSTLRVLRRAIKIAATPPMGPVYVCLPQDVLDAELVEAGPADHRSPRPASCPTSRCCVKRPPMLAAAERPMIFVGDGVAWSQAQAELARVAELLGAEVWARRRRRAEHELRPSALSGLDRPHVRRAQPADHAPAAT